MRNRTKIGLIILTVMMAMTLFTTPSGATMGWYTCNVICAGPSGSTIYIKLSDNSGAWSNYWYTPASGQENRMLAIALTALANGMKVYVNVDPASSSRTITTMYLLKN
jgi:hypothetical protein